MSVMNRLQLFWLIRRNNQLGFKRSPAFEQSMVGKVMAIIGGGLMMIYLIAAGVMFAMMANESDMPAFVLVLLPLLLLIDFGMRFMGQQTPLMLMKPYMLLPMPRRAVIDTFLLTSLLSGWNLLWLSLFLPYFIITLAGGTTFLTALTVLLCGMLLVVLNSQWYLMIRTLVARSLFWWLLPVVIYGLYFGLMFLDDKLGWFNAAADFIGEYGGSWWMLLLCIALLLVMLCVNRCMQYAFVYEEISREEKKPASLKKVSSFTFLERFGQSGEYLKLELKSILRNKAIRSRVLMSLGLVVMLSLIITFSNMYDNLFMLNFWCYYCFGIYGETTLVKIMGPEGNYIDLLMVHRENTLSLLRAKYYFHVSVLIVPLLLMLPAVFAGKFSLLMMAAYCLISSGLLNFIMFQLAVYNKQTLPLDQKITGKGNMENGLQLIIELSAMFLPILIAAVLLVAFSEVTAYLVLIVIGLLFTLSHPWWLRNVYQRMMARKYENLEGFHASR
jgi:hypothetical protein